MLRQIGFPKKLIGRLIAAYVLAAQLLDQPVLMRAMIALHSAFGLRRAGRDNTDAELGAHASKLRKRRLPGLFLGFAGGANIDVLPIRIQRLRNALLFNPSSQHVGRRPGGFLLH